MQLYLLDFCVKSADPAVHNSGEEGHRAAASASTTKLVGVSSTSSYLLHFKYPLG